MISEKKRRFAQQQQQVLLLKHLNAAELQDCILQLLLMYLRKNFLINLILLPRHIFRSLTVA